MKKILETVNITCPCGATVAYKNTMQGAINLGAFRKATGWGSVYDALQSSIWICPDCIIAAVIHAKALVSILGSKHASLASICTLESQEDSE